MKRKITFLIIVAIIILTNLSHSSEELSRREDIIPTPLTTSSSDYK